MRIVVRDTPAPQGSKRAFVNRHTGRPSVVESSAKVKPWREAVKHAALDVLGGYDVKNYLTDPVSVTVTFTLARPKGHYRTGKNAHLLRDSAPRYPAGKPDIDKLLRSTLDALGAAGVWRDDAQVVHVDVFKAYPHGALDALDVPGAVISIERLEAP